MKIIKDGKSKKSKGIREFICIYCGCDFEADNTEYIIHQDQDQVLGSWLEVCCPCCQAGLFFSA